MNYKVTNETKTFMRYSIAYILFFVIAFNVIVFTACALSDGSLDDLDESFFALPVSAASAFEHEEPSVESPVEESPNLIDTPIVFSEVVYGPFYDIDACNTFIYSAEATISELVYFVESGTYTEDACVQMNAEIIRLYDEIDKAKTEISTIERWRSEYRYATDTWLFLKQNGYSDVIASAIIGNMMIETSGGSLDIIPIIYDPSGGYYGLCQWSLYYRPEAADMPFEEQLDYLHNDMAKEFKTFGKCYKKGFTFEDFLAMDDPAEAALAFAKVYERCGSGSYLLRTYAAMEAYEYFTI
jgi:hypothetical protein